MFKKFSISGGSKKEDTPDPQAANISGPTDVKPVVHVEFDPETGTFKGLPDVWRSAVPEGCSTDEVSAKNIPSHVAPTAARKESIMKNPTPIISAPFNFEHRTHVTVDPNSESGFKGLPDEWRALLNGSGISKTEVDENPQAVLDSLQFFTEGPKPLPLSKEAETKMKEAVKIIYSDPRVEYTDLKKI
eukprot:GFYU01005952.1.p1 GENE.GFYU01005952.1~~GFYU01005952.1.p1  ORF type:complete len:188 (-),score=47.11 GFYU01005952.1:55-618(-)